jgi:hypothetical protein
VPAALIVQENGLFWRQNAFLLTFGLLLSLFRLTCPALLNKTTTNWWTFIFPWTFIVPLTLGEKRKIRKI